MTETKEKSFEEGNETLDLIQDVSVVPSPSPQTTLDSWSEDDDQLLKVLYEVKGCSIDVIATVFQKDVLSVEKRLEKLCLNKDN